MDEQKEEHKIDIRERAADFFNKHWPVVVSGGAGTILGMFILGQLSGIKVSTKDGFEIIVDRAKLPTELNIEGEWLYKSETNDQKTVFAGEDCRIRAGTARIKQKFGTSEVVITGSRIVRAECGKDKHSITNTSTPWKSEEAAIRQREGLLFFWLVTSDDKAGYGYVDAASIRSEEGKLPSEINNGSMFFLDDGKKTWFKSKINFYRVGTPNATALETNYPALKGR